METVAFQEQKNTKLIFYEFDDNVVNSHEFPHITSKVMFFEGNIQNPYTHIAYNISSFYQLSWLLARKIWTVNKDDTISFFKHYKCPLDKATMSDAEYAYKLMVAEELHSNI